MKTQDEVDALAREVNYLGDIGLTYTVSQDDNGCLRVEAYRNRLSSNLSATLSPWGMTLDGRELWRYERGGEPVDGLPVGTLSPLFIVALFE